MNSKIAKVRRSEDGEIISVILEDGTLVPINHAILMAKQGLIDGAIVMRGKNGGEYLKIDPNCEGINNIEELPTFR